MTDYGAIGKQLGDEIRATGRSVAASTKASSTLLRAMAQPGTPAWWGTRRPNAEPAAIYYVAGTVRQFKDPSNTVVPNCRVRLYARSTGNMAAAGLTKSDGTFRFDGLLPSAGGFYAVALDPDGAPLQNAVVADRLVALPTVAGFIDPVTIALSEGVGFSVAFKSHYVGEAVAWSVTAGDLPAGTSVSASGVWSGSPTATGAYSFTVTAEGSDYGSASLEISGSVEESRPYNVTLNGRTGLTQIIDAQYDDSNVNVGDLGFAFNFFGSSYQNNVFLGSNSYVTFGFGSSAYSGLSASNPGRGVLLAAADRSYRRVFVGPVNGGDGYCIRFEGGSSTGDWNDNIWEVTLYKTGVIGIVTATVPTGGTTGITDGSSFKGSWTHASNKAFICTPSGADFVVVDSTP